MSKVPQNITSDTNQTCHRDKEAIKRRDELLRAAYDLIKRNASRHFVLEAVNERTHYDECDNDGYALMNDIALELNLPDGEDTKPIPLTETHQGRK